MTVIAIAFDTLEVRREMMHELRCRMKRHRYWTKEEVSVEVRDMIPRPHDEENLSILIDACWRCLQTTW